MSDFRTLLEADLRLVKDRFAPGGELMPNCFRSMNGEFLDYRSRSRLHPARSSGRDSP